MLVITPPNDFDDDEDEDEDGGNGCFANQKHVNQEQVGGYEDGIDY